MDALYIYMGFSYLYMIGYKSGRDSVVNSGLGWIIPTLFSPLFVPFIMGLHDGSEKEDQN